MRIDVRIGFMLVSLIGTLWSPIARPEQPAPRALRAVVVPLSTQRSICPEVGPANAVRFRVDASRVSVAEWLMQPEAYAFLAIDANKNGVIDNATELVSNRMAERGGALDVLVSLATTSTPDLSRIEAGHPLYSSLLLWSDANNNGRSEFVELRPLSEFLAVVGLGVQRLPPTSPPQCPYRAWTITIFDWTGRPRPNHRLHHIYEVVFRAAS